MADVHGSDIQEALDRIHGQAASGLVRLTVHAHQEMVAERILMEDVHTALRTARLVENYPCH